MSGAWTGGRWVANRCGPAAPNCWNVTAELGTNERGLSTIRTIDHVLDYCGADEAEANAQLLAAAPELYRQLEIFVSTIVNDAMLAMDPELSAEVDTTLALLAKARGETA